MLSCKLVQRADNAVLLRTRWHIILPISFFERECAAGSKFLFWACTLCTQVSREFGVLRYAQQSYTTGTQQRTPAGRVLQQVHRHAHTILLCP